MPFSDLPFAQAGPEGAAGQPNPQPIPTVGGASYRKFACDSNSVQMDPTKVNALPASIKGAQSAVITFESADGLPPDGTVIARFWLDGTAPSSISGIPVYSGSSYEVQGGQDLANMRIFSVNAQPNVMQIQYFSQI